MAFIIHKNIYCMKTKKQFYFYLSFLLLLCSFSACDKNEMNVLPQETQLGKNTFGCMVYDKLFIGGGYYSYIGFSPLSAEYNKNYNRLTISTVSKVYSDKANGSIGLMLMNPIQDSIQKLSSGTYSSGSLSDCFQYLILNGGEIYLTKLDTIHKIVSGRFSFKGKCADHLNEFKVDGDSIKITQGRFDIKLIITND